MKKVLMYVGFGVIVVFVLVMALCSAFGGSESVTAEDKVAVNVPEGVAVPVSDSKTEAYRNSGYRQNSILHNYRQRMRSRWYPMRAI